MGLFSRKKEKIQPPSAINGNTKSAASTNTIKVLNRYEVKLNGVTAGKRQEVLSLMETNEMLKVKPILTRGTLGMSVIRSKNVQIGTIPSKIVNEIESKYGNRFNPVISKYSITKTKEGIYECTVCLQINSDK